MRGHGVRRGPTRRYLPIVPDYTRHHCRYDARFVFAGDAGTLGDNQRSGSRRTDLDGDDDVDHRRRAMA